MINSTLPAQIREHIEYAQQTANLILKPTALGAQSTPIYYNREPSFFENLYFGSLFYPRTVHHYHYDESYCSADDSKERRNQTNFKTNLVSFLAVGLLSALVLSSFGSSLGTYLNATRDLEKLKEEKEKAQFFLNPEFENAQTIYKHRDAREILFNIHAMFAKEKKVLESSRDSARNSLLIKTTLVVGAVAFGYGLYKNSQNLFGVGLGMMGGGILAWAFKTGLDSTNNETYRNAQDLHNTLEYLRRV